MRKIVKQIVLSAFALLVITSCSKDEEVIPPAKYAVDLSTKNYGNVEVEATVSQTFKISNKGGKDLVLESFTIKNTSEFSTNAVRATVKSGKNYVFKVNFTPTSAGSKTATLDIATNVGKHKITLKGTATPKPKAVFFADLTSVDFGTAELNKSVVKNITVTNKGNADLVIKTISFLGANADQFTANATTPITVNPNKTSTIEVAFKSTTAGDKTASVQLETNVGNHKIALKGKATAQAVAVFGIDPASKDFGSVEVRKLVKQTFTIKNTGNSNLIISELSITGNNRSEFPFNGIPVTPITVAPNKTVSISIAFNPVFVGNKSASLNIKSNVGNQAVALKGNAIAAAKAIFNINPTSKDFGNVEANKTVRQTFTIKNTGNANLTINGFSFIGANKSDFVVDGGSTPSTPFTVEPNKTKNVAVIFKSKTAGNKTATLNIATNVGVKTVTLKGKITQPATACATPVNIPNANFKNALLDHGRGITGGGVSRIDTNGDGIICTDEATAYVGRINVSGKSITDLTGIEAFTNITELSCNDNQLTKLDVTKNTLLKTLLCDNNRLTSLNVTKNTSLKGFSCSNNKLTSLDVTKNTSLKNFYCDSNQLTNLDVSKNTLLRILRCSENQLTNLDVTKNTRLTQLNCSSNQLASLDVTKKVFLEYLYCNNNQLTSLDVTNTRLSRLYCNNNQLTSLNVANGRNSTLRYMNASNNPNLTCIQHDSGFTPTTSWGKDSAANWSTNCSGGGSTSCATPVNIPNDNFKRALLAHGASIIGTGISKIDTNGDGIICTDEATAYTGTISVYSRGITDLTGIEAFTNITGLICYSNQLTNLDVTKNTSLKNLNCINNKLTSLDVTKNTSLKNFSCSNNKLTSLDVTKNTSLNTLYCKGNQLTSLDVTKNTQLQKLDCNNNQLTSLDVTKIISLRGLFCYNNKLTSLNVANGVNSSIQYMVANNNPNLTCIQHDGGFTPTAQWIKDRTANWSTNCP